jgi:iron(II)-dependent oxidoreductase
MTSLEEIIDSRQAALARALAEATEYTDSLLAPLDDDQLMRQFTPLQSPLVWDIAHIAHYEELWLVRKITGGEATDERLDDVYDAFAHSRADRGGLQLLGPGDARAFRASVRERSLDNLDRLEQAADERLALDAYAVGLVMQHELQHAETMCQTLQAAPGLEYPLTDEPEPSAVSAGGDVLVPGGPFELGSSNEPWAYDNEREAHTVDLPAFRIDTTAVTNAAYGEFIGDGGYRERRHWSDAGWEWLRDERAEAPLAWLRNGAGFVRRRFGRIEEIPAGEPVQHVCYFEAEAYASWAGRRLPSEAEWEKAATWTPQGEKLVQPWGDAPHAGRANTGRVRFAPAPVGTYPAGASPWGCHGMLGDVWEWTSSPFTAYPGFSAFPYREYSEVFFGGDYRVLRGGSWATHPYVARATFRNWDHPQRRQIFSGFRTARDA